MGLLDGLRGGQYLGFTTDNVPVIDLMKIAPKMTVPQKEASSASSDKGDEFDINSYKGDASNFIANIESANMDMSEGKRKMQQGVMLAQSNPEEGTRLLNEGNSQFIKGRTNYTIAKAVKPTIEYHREQMTKATEPYEQNRIALDQSGSIPINFKGDENTSILDPRAYDYEQQPVRFSGYNMFQDAVTQDYPSWNFKTNTPGQNPYNSPTGSLKGTNYSKTLEERFARASNVSDMITTLSSNPLYVQNAGMYNVIVNENRIDKHKKNNDQINAVNQSAYNLLNDQEKLQVRQEVIDFIRKDPVSALIDLKKPIGDFTTEENAQAYFNSLRANMPNSPYRYMQLIEEKNEDGKVVNYKAFALPIDINGTESQIQRDIISATTEPMLKYYDEQLVANTALNMKDIYSFDEYDLTYFRAATNPPKGGAGGGAGLVPEYNKLNSDTAAFFRIASSINKGTYDQQLQFKFGDNTFATIKVARSDHGANYKYEAGGRTLNSNNVIYANVNGSYMPFTNLSGWKVEENTGSLASMPDIAVPIAIAEQYYAKSIPDAINKVHGGNDPMIGLTNQEDLDKFFSSSKGLLPIKDLTAIIGYDKSYKDANGNDRKTYVPGRLDTDEDYNDYDKQIMKKVYDGVYNFPIGTEMNNRNNFNQLVKLAQDPKLTPKAREDILTILTGAGKILAYKEQKDDYSDPRLNKNNQVVNVPSYYLPSKSSAAGVGNFSGTGGWNEYDSPTMFRSSNLSIQINNDAQSIFDNTKNIQVTVKSGALKGNHSLEEIMSYYGIEKEESAFSTAFTSAVEPSDWYKSDRSLMDNVSALITELEDVAGIEVIVPFTGSKDPKENKLIFNNAYVDTNPVDIAGPSGGAYYKDLYSITEQMGAFQNITPNQNRYLTSSTQRGPEGNVTINYSEE